MGGGGSWPVGDGTDTPPGREGGGGADAPLAESGGGGVLSERTCVAGVEGIGVVDADFDCAGGGVDAEAVRAAAVGDAVCARGGGAGVAEGEAEPACVRRFSETVGA